MNYIFYEGCLLQKLSIRKGSWDLKTTEIYTYLSTKGLSKIKSPLGNL